jgi:hypothetical protein
MYFDYLDALAGSGKTHWVIEKALELAEDGEKVLIAVPSKRLADEEYLAKLRKCRLPVRVIHSDNAYESPVADINDHFLTPYLDGQILVITQQALERIVNCDRSDWHLFVDEIPQVYQVYEKNLSSSHTYLTPHLDMGDDFFGYRQLNVHNMQALIDLAKSAKSDDVKGYFGDIARLLVSPHWRSYVEPNAYNNLIEKSANAKKLTIFSVLQPSVYEGFKTVCVCGAHFDRSLFYDAWQANGITFCKIASPNLRFSKHEGTNVTIFFATENRWSKHLAFKNKKNPALFRLAIFFETHIDGKFFIYSQNAAKNPLFPKFSYDRMIPSSSHGLNSYIGTDHIMLFQARNPIPSQIEFIKNTRGLTSERISEAIHKEVVYQNVMRCSIRDPNNENPKSIYVPDSETAEWLHTIFPGSKLVKLETGIPEFDKPKNLKNPKPKSDAERQTTARDKKRRLDALIAVLNPHALLNTCKKHIQSTFNFDEKSLDLYRGGVTEFRGSLFKRFNSKKPFDILHTVTVEDFEESLCWCFHNEIKENKGQNWLISPSLFDSEKGKKDRGLDNIVFSNGIFLDFDGGGFGPQDFADVFNDIRATTYTTFSSTIEEPRFRVYIPTKQAMTKEGYQATVFALESRLDEGGIPKKSVLTRGIKAHNLDGSKRNSASMFYLPCQPKSPQSDYYGDFQIWKGPERLILDPEKLVDAYLRKLHEEVKGCDIREDERTSAQSAAYKTIGIAWALNDWQRTCKEPHQGSSNFNRLAFRLARAGCDSWELRSYLKDAARDAIHPREREKQIPDLVSRMSSKYMITKMKRL